MKILGIYADIGGDLLQIQGKLHLVFAPGDGEYHRAENLRVVACGARIQNLKGVCTVLQAGISIQQFNFAILCADNRVKIPLRRSPLIVAISIEGDGDRT